MRRPWPAAGSAIAGLLVFACNALTGASDLSEEPTVVDAGPGDAPVTPVVEASIDAPPPPPDTGPPPPCPGVGRSCVPAPPAGWEGPFLAYEGARADAPACPAEMPDAADEDIGTPTGAIACSSCSCGAVQNAGCNATITGYPQAACAGAPLPTVPLNTTTCYAPSAGGYLSARARASYVAGSGSCGAFVPPSGKVKSPITWSNVLRLCAKATPFGTDGCGVGELCVPDGATPFKTHACIRSDLDGAECPAPWTTKIVAFENVTDTRDCTATGCSCASATGVDCDVAVRHFSEAEDCATGASANRADNICLDTPVGTSQRAAMNSLQAAGGSCAPSGTPTATGGVVGGGDQTTICCLP